MIKFIDEILNEFRDSFSRKKTFEWFVIVIIGIIIKNDGIGITSIIRELYIDPHHYECLMNFFRSDAWTLERIRRTWAGIIKNSSLILKLDGYSILIGDGIKIPKESKKSPGVKKHHQDSENSTKAKYMFGHHFGVISVLCGFVDKQFSIPLSSIIQDGANEIRKFFNQQADVMTHAISIIDQALKTAEVFGKSIILLDAYFLGAPMLKKS